MKYIVMECHEGYAILMDEDSRFVNAANLHYKVGQSVTDPIIMDEQQRSGRIKMYVTRFAAAAACIGVLATAGTLYYTHNLKPYSTILISSDAKIRMSINRNGKVIEIKSDDEDGKELLKNYDGKGKDKLTAANEIIELEKEKGMISSGDTVNIYVDSEKNDGYSTFRSDLEKENSDINVKVRGLDIPVPSAKEKVTIAKPDPAKGTAAPEPPKPEKDGVKAPEPPAPADVTPPAPADPPLQQQPVTPNPDTKHDPPAPPSDPEPPKAPEKPVTPEKPAAPEAPKPDEAAEPPKPPTPAEGEKLPDAPKKPLSIMEDALIDIQKNKPITLEGLRPAALLSEPEPKQDGEAPADLQKEAHPPTDAPSPLHPRLPSP